MPKTDTDLISTLSIISVAMNETIEAKFPQHSALLTKSFNPTLKEEKGRFNLAKMADWTFFIIAAGAGIALSTKEVSKGEHSIIRKALRNADPNLMSAVDNFQNYLDKYADSDLQDDRAFMIIGQWILWNIKGKKPTPAEIRDLSFIIGHNLFTTVIGIRSKRL